jgi:glycosyltransferase involved in cell wall biosynthesis
MDFVFLGAYDPAYPRNAVLRYGLEQAGARVRECRLPSSAKFWLRYPIGLARFGPVVPRSDVVFVPEFCHKDVPLARLLAGLFARRLVFDPLAGRYETKIIDWRRRQPGSLRAWWNLTIDRLSFGLSPLILADTQAHKGYYVGAYGLSPDRIAVLPVGYDDRVFKPASRLAPARSREFNVLFFGSFLPLHGAESIVEAAAIVLKKDPSVRFSLVGSGQTFEAARVKADCLGLSNVRFEGWLAAAALPTSIARADVCLGIFGATEKAGRVVPHKVYQSLGMRKPVITARTPAIEEFFRHREHLLLCEPPYAQSLAAAVLTLKKNAALRRRLAENGYRLVKAKYSPRPLGERLLALVDVRLLRGDAQRSRR